MPIIQFTQMQLTGFKRDAKKGQASFVSALTKKLSKQLEWQDLPESYAGGSPGGELMASSMVVSNAAGELAKYEYTINANKVHSFELIRHEIEGKRGKGYRFAVHFKVDFQDPDGCGMLEQYFVAARDSKGTLAVTYNPPAVQVDMSDVQADPEVQASLLDDKDADEDED